MEDWHFYVPGSFNICNPCCGRSMPYCVVTSMLAKLFLYPFFKFQISSSARVGLRTSHLWRRLEFSIAWRQCAPLQNAARLPGHGTTWQRQMSLELVTWGKVSVASCRGWTSGIEISWYLMAISFSLNPLRAQYVWISHWKTQLFDPTKSQKSLKSSLESQKNPHFTEHFIIFHPFPPFFGHFPYFFPRFSAPKQPPNISHSLQSPVVGGDKEALTEACGSEEVADEILMLCHR